MFCVRVAAKIDAFNSADIFVLHRIYQKKLGNSGLFHHNLCGSHLPNLPLHAEDFLRQKKLIISSIEQNTYGKGDYKNHLFSSAK